jgi:uncharacterized SAM-binding protein YcdF (DUF218 family)
VSSFGWFLFSSGGAILVLALAAAWVALSAGSRASRRFLVGAATLYWLGGAFVVPDTVRTLMAAGYAPLARTDVPTGRTAVVLLGSGSHQFRDWSDNTYAIVDPIGASRLLEAARVFRLLGADYVISSGGVPSASERNRPAGATMADALQTLGVPRDRILIEIESRTTHEEAVILKDMLARHPVDHVVLVTSQFHMRRSVGAFKAVGIDVVPAIAREPRGFDTWWEKVVPTDKGLGETAMASHELAGIVAYATRGWFRF